MVNNEESEKLKFIEELVGTAIRSWVFGDYKDLFSTLSTFRLAPYRYVCRNASAKRFEISSENEYLMKCVPEKSTWHTLVPSPIIN